MTALHIETAGQGPDLVLLHGWAMHSGIWGSVRDALAQHFRLHLVDLPGHGLSPACEPGTLDHLTEIIAAILPERCLLGGWSLGGQIAMQLALQQPQRVEKLVLISTTPCFAWQNDWPSGMDRKLLQMFLENLKLNYTPNRSPAAISASCSASDSGRNSFVAMTTFSFGNVRVQMPTTCPSIRIGW